MTVDLLEEVGAVDWTGTPADLERGVRLIWKMEAFASVNLFNEIAEALTREGQAKDED